MTVLSVVKAVCSTVGVQVPSTVFGNLGANRTMQEMLAVANEAAQSIAADHREWTALRVQGKFIGDGITESFTLPANFRRLLLTSNIWRSTRTQWPMRFVADADVWMQRRASGGCDGSGEWTIFGGQMHIQPILLGPVYTPAPLPSWWLNARDYVIGETAADAADNSSWQVTANHTSAAAGTFAEDRAPPNEGNWAALPLAPPVMVAPAETANFIYIDRNPVAFATGGFGEEFVADGDRFRLDERLLKLCMIWKWKQLKGSAYAEDLGTYGDALNVAAGFDQPAPIIVGGYSSPDARGWGNGIF